MRLQIYQRLFDVAFKLHKGVEEIGRLSPLLLAMWEHYLEFNDPERRYDQRFGFLIAAVQNQYRTNPVDPKVYMFFSDAESSASSKPVEMTEEQYLQFMAAAAAARASA